MKKTTVALLMLVTVASIMHGQQQRSGIVAIDPGFFKGEEFLQMPEAQQEGFAAGLVDGIYLAPLFGAPGKNIESFHRCIVGMSTSQVAAIIQKYLKDHPEKWHQRLSVEAYSALESACRGN